MHDMSVRLAQSLVSSQDISALRFRCAHGNSSARHCPENAAAGHSLAQVSGITLALSRTEKFIWARRRKLMPQKA